MLVGLRSRRQIAPFDMHQPATVQQALALHQSSGRSVFMAGGTDLIDWLKYGHTIEHLIRLDGIPELAAIRTGPNGVRIGATATHAALIDSQTIRAELPDFGAAHPQPVCVTLQPDAPLTSLPAHAGALAAQVIQRLPEPASDVRASASYRRRMIEVLTRRILIRAGGTA